jgi:hypothetical protein
VAPKPSGTGFGASSLGTSNGGTPASAGPAAASPLPGSGPADLLGKLKAGAAGMIGTVSTLAVGFVAGRYLTSGGELNWLKDMGQIPHDISQTTVADASRALDASDGYRPTMDALSKEQRGRFLEGAAAIGRHTRSDGPSTRQRLETLYRAVAESPDGEANADTDPFTYTNYMDVLRRRYGPLDKPLPVPVESPTATDEEKRKRLNVGSRAVLQTAPAKGIIEAQVSHVHVPQKKGDDPPRNLVHNRLIHDFAPGPMSSGHDGIHLISGFSLNGKTAGQLAPFPMTYLDLTNAMLDPIPSDQQRNVNGLAIESMADGLWEAIKVSVDLKSVVANAPAGRREAAETVLRDLDERTGFKFESNDYNVPYPSDTARQAYELAEAGAGRIGINYFKVLSYQAADDMIWIHTGHFETMLAANPQAAAELKANLETYLSFTADALSRAEAGEPMMPARVEINVSPETTRLLMETAIKGFEDLHRLYPRSPAFPELINYYRSILQRGEDGTPAIVQLPDPARDAA